MKSTLGLMIRKPLIFKCFFFIIFLMHSCDGPSSTPLEAPPSPKISTFRIITSASEGGLITPSQNIQSGQSVSIKATPDEQYQLKEWKGDCGSFSKNDLEVRLTPSRDCEITAIFEKMEASNMSPQIGESETINNKIRIALLVIDFPDTSSHVVFPTVSEIERSLEEGVVLDFFETNSYGNFEYEIISFGPFIHEKNYNDLEEIGDVFKTKSIQINGFKEDDFDVYALIPRTDKKYDGAAASSLFDLHVNHQLIGRNKWKLVNPLFLGDFTNSFVTKDYFIESYPFTSFERIFTHELIHCLDIATHAKSRTNGESYHYQPEIANNGENLSLDYGNQFDIMGGNNYGYNLNVAFRDQLAWVSSTQKTVISKVGRHSVTVYSINDAEKVTTVAIKTPKGDQFYIEYRNFDFWDQRSHLNDSPSIMSNNRQGIMVNWLDAWDTPHLLDMSPSPNYTYQGDHFDVGSPDIRDVVLKPGMTYDSPSVMLSNVTANTDGSYTFTIDVKP